MAYAIAIRIRVLQAAGIFDREVWRKRETCEDNECDLAGGVRLMRSEFSLGDRVRVSALGAKRCPRLTGKSGTVVGRSVYVNSVAILFDGNKSPRTIHSAYLEAVEERSDELHARR